VTVIKNAGFEINPSKTRMQLRTGRQIVTGLTVNAKVNVPRPYAGSARAMCNSLFRTGTYHRRVPITPPPEGGPGYEMSDSLNQLEGILSYIHHIKLQSEATKARKPSSKFDVPGRELYKQFLFYKYFVALSQPIIICEGRTDNIYMKYALRHLNDF